MFFYTQTSIAEPLAPTIQGPQTQQKSAAHSLREESTPAADPAEAAGTAATDMVPDGDGPAFRTPESSITSVASSAGPAQPYTATAYSLRGRTASGRGVSRGLIAADRKVLPLGTRVRLDAGPYSGEYLVADTGGLVRGRKIDIWVPSTSEAMRFGRRTVKLTVLTYGGRRPTPQPRSLIRK
jgi:3D (Asp-Asp-Asp) domain-containing protein